MIRVKLVYELHRIKYDLYNADQAFDAQASLKCGHPLRTRPQLRV